MTIFYAGTEVDTVNLVSGATWATDSVTTHYDTRYSGEALGGRPAIIEYDGKFSADTTNEFHTGFTLFVSSWANNTTFTIISWLYVGVEQVRLRLDNSTTTTVISCIAERWISGSWQSMGTFTLLGTSLLRLAIHLKLAASGGFIRIYNNGALIHSFAGDTSTDANKADKLRTSGTFSSSSTISFSELIVSSAPVFEVRVKTLNPNAAGNYSEWTNGFANIDEDNQSDADSISSNTVNQRFTANSVDLATTITSNNRILGVQVNTRVALQAASTPTDMQFLIREGGTDTTSPSIGLTADGVIRSFTYKWELNPRTAAVWTVAEANAAEIGFKAV